ncbi:MAG: hypothetical protein DRH12_10405 [Deltaproteobacteria bacterium]|nr:MAG: hypothetical protein DRH12_10405 [Deltaproteobacteria bacterium]
MEKIGHLKLVTIEVQALSDPQASPNDQPGRSISFIFGLGPGGLTPFEMKLWGKGVGEELVLETKKLDMQSFLGHNLLWFLPDTKLLQYPRLRVEVKGIKQAGDREVIRAMAEITEFGHGCSCC